MADAKEIVKHSLARFISVACVGIVIAGLVWAVYAAFIKPTTNPLDNITQKAAQINNPHYNPQPNFGGCANMKVIEYYRKPNK